jgi:DNA adenine methylase
VPPGFAPPRLERLQFRHLPRVIPRSPRRTEPSAIASRRSSAAESLAPASREHGARPFLKWAGGKTQLVPELVARSPRRIDTYYEPFLGGGAMFFALAGDPELAPRRAVLNDANRELVTVYEVVRDEVARLIARLEALATPYLAAGPEERAEIYYAQRARTPDDHVDTAARFIFLNKTCFNGLYRVNRRGEFNVPHGRYLTPRILDEPALHAAAAALRDVELMTGDFATAASRAQAGDFVYFDPPFEPLSKTSSFTGYTEGAFSRHEQVRLKWLFDDLTERGVAAMLSNSPAEWLVGIYEGQRAHLIDGNVERQPGYQVERTPARRAINSRGDRRGVIDELIVTNYPRELSRGRLESSASSSSAADSSSGSSPSARGAGAKVARGTGKTK